MASLYAQAILPQAANALFQPNDAFSTAAVRGEGIRASQANTQNQNAHAQQRNVLFEQQGEDRQRAMQQEQQNKQLQTVREDLASYLMASDQAKPQVWAQLAPKYGQDPATDPNTIIPQFIQSNPGILGPEVSQKVLEQHFAPKTETYGAPVEALGPDGKPMFIRPGKNGGMEPVPGYSPIPQRDPSPQRASWGQPVDETGSNGESIRVQYDNTGQRRVVEGAKPHVKLSTGMPSEDERKSAFLLQRLENAEKDMTANPNDMKPELDAEIVRAIPLMPEAAANSVTSTKRQIVEGAQLDALDAALTLATGAAYTRDQLKNLSKSYFPQLGDEPDTVTAKKSRFDNLISSAKVRAGRAAVPQQNGATGSWSIKKVP